MDARRHLPKPAKLRLVLLLVLGGGIGALAGFIANRTVQLTLVGIAICFGIFAGVTVRRALVGNNVQ